MLLVFVYFYKYYTVFVSGVLVPGGFGSRGAEGKITAARWARKNKIPYLGRYLNSFLIVFAQ